jgi:hypothetical protein
MPALARIEESGRIDMGQNGVLVHRGRYFIDDTATTFTIRVPMTRVDQVFFQDEQSTPQNYFWTQDTAQQGYVVGTNGLLTLSRIGATSNSPVSVLVFGV